MLSHTNLWAMIDRLAERNGLTPSGLARKAGLNPTIFNLSKRKTGRRAHWPSMESISAILKATDCPLDMFASLLENTKPRAISIPALTLTQATLPYAFDAENNPNPSIADSTTLFLLASNNFMALEVDTKALEPLYSEGAFLILSLNEKPRRNDRVAVRTTANDIHVKALGREGAQKIELSPLTPDDLPLTLARRDIQWIRRIIWASQ